MASLVNFMFTGYTQSQFLNLYHDKKLNKLQGFLFLLTETR